MGFEELKQILFSEILDENRRKEILIEAYIHNPHRIRKMAKEGKIPNEAMAFLDNNIQKLTDVPSQITIQFFRNNKYEELIKAYCDKKVSEQIEKKPVNIPVRKNNIEVSAKKKDEALNQEDHYGFIEARAKERLIKNWSDKPKSFMKDLIELTGNGNIVWVESKSEKTFYVVLDDYGKIKIRKSENKGKTSYSLTRDNKEQIAEKYYAKLYEVIKGEPYKLDSAKENKKNKPGKVEIIYVGKTEPIHGYDIYECLVPVRSANKKKQQIKNLEIHKSVVKRIKEADKECGYLIRRTDDNELKWNRVKNSGLKDNVYTALDNGKKLLLHCYSTENAFLYRFYVNGELNTIGGIQQYLEKIILAKRPTLIDLDLSGYYPSKEQKVRMKKENPVVDKTQHKRQVKVGFKDFVVRRNIFKCMHNKHAIEDIDAIVMVMNKNIEIEEVTVAAGYCKQCDMFFMMESTYQQLRRKGVVAFRAIDEKSYLSQNYLNGKLLAQESILMQFGYSVSQAEGLSEERRHKILSVLVDNHILTKSEIISYLDFFINQRKSDKFAMAVAKWTIDRNYIRNYKIGEYSRIGVVYRNE